MTKIQSRVHNYGNEKEDSWPPQFPKKPGAGFHGYWDAEAQCFKEGTPPCKEKKYGSAPTVIFDSMPRTYHHGVGREIDSRADWKDADNASGTITFGSKEDAKPRVDEANEKKKKKKELRKASLTALKAYQENPREVSQRVEKQTIEKIETAKRDLGIEI